MISVRLFSEISVVIKTKWSLLLLRSKVSRPTSRLRERRTKGKRRSTGLAGAASFTIGGYAKRRELHEFFGRRFIAKIWISARLVGKRVVKAAGMAQALSGISKPGYKSSS